MVLCYQHDKGVGLCYQHDEGVGLCYQHDKGVGLCYQHDEGVGMCCEHDEGVVLWFTGTWKVLSVCDRDARTHAPALRRAEAERARHQRGGQRALTATNKAATFVGFARRVWSILPNTEAPLPLSTESPDCHPAPTNPNLRTYKPPNTLI